MGFVETLSSVQCTADLNVYSLTSSSPLQCDYPELTVAHPAVETALHQTFFALLNLFFTRQEHQDIPAEGGVMDLDSGLFTSHSQAYLSTWLDIVGNRSRGITTGHPPTWLLQDIHGILTALDCEDRIRLERVLAIGCDISKIALV